MRQQSKSIRTAHAGHFKEEDNKGRWKIQDRKMADQKRKTKELGEKSSSSPVVFRLSYLVSHFKSCTFYDHPPR